MALAGSKNLKLALFKPEPNQVLGAFQAAQVQLPANEEKKFKEEDIDVPKKARR